MVDDLRLISHYLKLFKPADTASMSSPAGLICTLRVRYGYLSYRCRGDDETELSTVGDKGEARREGLWKHADSRGHHPPKEAVLVVLGTTLVGRLSRVLYGLDHKRNVALSKRGHDGFLGEELPYLRLLVLGSSKLKGLDESTEAFVDSPIFSCILEAVDDVVAGLSELPALQLVEIASEGFSFNIPGGRCVAIHDLSNIKQLDLRAYMNYK